MNKYKVEIDFVKFIFDDGEAALSFAEVARRHIRNTNAGITINIVEEEDKVEAEDGR